MSRRTHPLHSPRPIAVSLIVIALAVELLLVAGPLRSFFLPDHYATPLLDLGKLTAFGVDAGVGFLAFAVAIFGLYCAAVRLAYAVSDPKPLVKLGVGAGLVFAATLVFVYPYGAADVFDYSFYGRIIEHYGENPFLSVPSQFAGDPFLPYVAWKDLPFTYGPLWALLSFIASKLGGDQLLLTMLIYKAIAVLFYAIDLWLIGAILSRTSPKLTMAGVVLFGWSPLVVTEVAANGHNDVVMIFFVLVGIYVGLGQSRKSAGAALALAGVSTLVKFATGMLLPLFIASLWRRPGPTARRALALTLAALAVIAVTVLAYLPFWQGPATLAVQRRGGLYTVSFPAIIKLVLESHLSISDARFVGYIAIAAFAAYVLVEAVRQGPTSIALISASYRVTLVYLLFACLWFQPWYLVWLVALAALVPEVDVAALAVLFSFSASMNYFVFDYLWQWNPSLDLLAIQVIAVTVVYAAPFTYLIWRGLPRSSRARERWGIADVE